MISIDDRDCNQKFPSVKKVQWSNNKLEDEDENKPCTPLRRSRKGTSLNDPVEFYKKQEEQSIIRRMLVLPTGGCCDMEYVMLRKNRCTKLIQKRKNIPCNKKIQNPPSITISIGPSLPFHLNPTLSTLQSKTSLSTLSINPTVMSEEMWQPQEHDIPSVISSNYCENTIPCLKVPSSERTIINLDLPQRTLKQENFVYVTAPPKISPLKCCWNCFGCRRKHKKNTYLPAVMTRNEPHRSVIVCPSYLRNTNLANKSMPMASNNQVNFVPSRLSTITESEISSQHLSEELKPQKENGV